MATPTIPMDSHSTALVLLPPTPIQCRVNDLRSTNDKSFPRWTSHITLLFPFVQPEHLTSTITRLRTAVADSGIHPFAAKLDKLDRFHMRQYTTVYLGPGKDGTDEMQALWRILSEAMGYKGRPFVPHMTLGQTGLQRSEIKILEEKGRILAGQGIAWTVGSVVVLKKDEEDGGKMKIFDEIFLDDISAPTTIASEYPCSYHFGDTRWTPSTIPPPPAPLAGLKIATYNILHDAAHPLPPRFARLKSTMLETGADIVCLQEVTDDFIALLLLDTDIRSTWAWSSRSPASVLESERNVIVLAREYLPFSWKRLALGAKHKSAAVCTISAGDDSPPLVLAAVHLTAGRTPEKLKAKSDEFGVLLAYLQSAHGGDRWIIVGDTNFPNDYSPQLPHDIDLADAWLTCHDDAVTTYDPNSNPLAATTSRFDKSPQRYDRIYFKKDSGMLIVDAHLSGFPTGDAGPASDHWALTAEFSFSTTSQAQPQFIAKLTDTPSAPQSLSQSTHLTDTDLVAFLDIKGVFPSAELKRKRASAITALCSLLEATDGTYRPISPVSSSDDASKASPVKLVAAPVGSYALGTDTVSSDVDCLVVGNIGATTFWNLARSKFRSQRGASEPVLKLRRFVKTAAVPMMECEYDGVKIDIQYSPAANVAEHWRELPTTPLESSLFSLPVSTLRPLNAYRDIVYLLQHIPSLPTFRLASLFIKTLCDQRGISTSRFGYFGGVHITLLLARLAITLPASTTASQLVREFFYVYAKWDWAGEMVTWAPAREVTHRRTPREPMVILSIERPVENISRATRPTLDVLRQVLGDVDRMLGAGCSWSELCGNHSEFVHRFLTEYNTYLKVDVSFWGESCMRGRALVGYLESRIGHLLVQVYNAVPTVHAQFWPARFTDEPSDEPTSSVQGFYLIGLSAGDSSAQKNTSIPASVLRMFEDDCYKNARFYDPAEAFISVTEVSRDELSEAVSLDPHQWSDNNIDGEESDEEDKEEPDSDSEDDVEVETSAAVSKNQKRRAAKAKPATPFLPAQKLRTSADVYHRLIWDHNDKEEYVIGYEDRFKV